MFVFFPARSGISSSSSPNDSNRKTTKQIVPTSTESFRENIITKEDAPITSPASMVLVNTTPESVAASAQLLTTNNNNNNGKLYRVEERAEGAVNRRTYYKWLAAGAFCKGQAILSGLTVFALFLITQAFKVFSDLWIGLWVRSGAASLVYGLVPYYVAIFFLLVFAMSRALVFVSVASEASTKLHDDLFKVLLKAPVNLFFDITPSGRILNRLSNDLDHIDTRLPETALQLLHSMALICGALALAIYASPWICLAVIPLIFVFRSLAKRLSNTQRQVKRYDGTTRSPLFSHFSETLAGLHSIRAFNVCDEFVAENKTLINKNTVFFLCFWTSARWFALRVDCLAVMVQFVLCALIYSTERQDVAVAGLAVTYSLLLTTTVQACTRHAVETENAMVACERIVELIETVPQERDTGDRDFLMTKGQVEFVNVSARYRPNLDLVLRNVSFKVEGGKRVGVCGRTGAGKSSLGSLIFGMVEIENDNGMILFDGKNQKDIALSQLRSQLAVIPQNPVLFSGTIRFAIDPWNSAKSDAEIWKVLEQVELSNFVKMLGGLDGRVEESGASFSVGERQLLCVSRALFRKNVKVVLVDEGTASVDAHSDVIVQKAINEGFVGATKFTIAHRLHTIIHSDLIIVLDKGNLMEFNSPQELLKMNDGIFKSLWDQENQINKDN